MNSSPSPRFYGEKEKYLPHKTHASACIRLRAADVAHDLGKSGRVLKDTEHLRLFSRLGEIAECEVGNAGCFGGNAIRAEEELSRAPQARLIEIVQHDLEGKTPERGTVDALHEVGGEADRQRMILHPSQHLIDLCDLP